MSPWLLLVLLWPLWRFLSVFRVAQVVLGLRFPRLVVEAIADESVPASLVEATRRWIEELGTGGFLVLGAWRTVFAGARGFDEDVVVLAHPTLPIRALLRPHPAAEHSGEFWLELRSTTAAGAEISTASYACDRLTPLPPHFDLGVLPSNSVRELLAHHEARLGAEARSAWRCTSLASAVRREQSICDGSYAHLRGCGAFREGDDGTLTFRLWPALQCARQLLRAAGVRRKNARKASAASGVTPLSSAAQVSFDWLAYQRHVTLAAGDVSRRLLAVIGPGAILLLTAVLVWRLSPAVGISFLGAVLLHEGGHFLGMRLFGYRDAWLVLIPFVGSAMAARDNKIVRPWQEAIVILLGPLPGLALGFGLLCLPLVDQLAWLSASAWTLILVNGCNLLPVLPLDGGRLIDVAVASRFPRARIFFQAGGALVLMLVGLLLQLPWISSLGLLLLVGIPRDWKLVPVRAEVRNSFPLGGEEAPVVYRLLEHMRESAWKSIPPARRLDLVHRLQRVLRLPRPGYFTMVLALLAFTSPWWLLAPLGLWQSAHRLDLRWQEAAARAAAVGLGAPPKVELMPGPSDDNAGRLYEQARLVAAAAAARSGSIDAAARAKIVGLLRVASHKKFFVPVTAPRSAAVARLGAPRFAGPGSLLGLLAEMCEEQLGAQKAADAAATAADALWLARLLDASPGYWDWTTHHAYQEKFWQVIESAIAARAKLRAGLVADLRELTDEAPGLTFGRNAIPIQLAERARMLELQAPKWGLDALLVLTGITHTRVQEVEYFDDAVRVRAYLATVGGERWPALPPGSLRRPDSEEAIRELADEVAGLRLARVVFLLAERAAAGAAVSELRALGGEGRAIYPLSGEPATLRRRGAGQVLEFARARGQPGKAAEDDAEGAPDLLAVRLPAETP